MASVGYPVAGTWLGGSKRKCTDDVADEFAEFSLSSSARKIRRLDAFINPVTTGKGLENGMDFNLAQRPIELGVHENKPYVPPNEERALVLYKPMSPSPGVSFQVDHDFISELKESWSDRLREEAKAVSSARGEADNRLAVVPWVPTRFDDSSSSTDAPGTQDQQQYSTEAEANAEEEPMSMDVEEENAVVDSSSPIMSPVASGIGLQQWQQHCMSAAPAVNAAKPVMWSW